MHDHSSMSAPPSTRVDIAKSYSKSFWYIVLVSVGIFAVVRSVNAVVAHQRLRACRSTNSANHPSRPSSNLVLAWATATALIRELSNGQCIISYRWLAWLTPPSAGRVILLFTYWAVILYMMFAQNAVTNDVYFWERIGYRNAWTTIMQLPLVYLLAGKANVIGFVIGISHERLNWLHRWVARTMFVTATVHGWHFWAEWARADYVQTQLKAMPMVTYGLAAWAILLWIVITGLYPARHFAYEIFVVQHIISVVVLLWTVYKHVPDEAMWFVYLAIGAIALDRLARWTDLVWYNIRILPSIHIRRSAPHSFVPTVSFVFPKSRNNNCRGDRMIGHQAIVVATGDSTILTIKDVHFTWQAGQHLYLWIPRIGPFEAHPYTISCAHQLKSARCCCNSIQLVIRAHSGFSGRLHRFGLTAHQKTNKHPDVTAFVSSPYGRPPRVDVFETLILISASTGASFTLPIVEGVVLGDTGCTRRVEFILLARYADEVELYVGRVRDLMAKFRQKGVQLNVHVAITGSSRASRENSSIFSSKRTMSTLGSGSATGILEGEAKRGQESVDVELAASPVPVQYPGSGCCCHDGSKEEPPIELAMSQSTDLVEYSSRPDLGALIRTPVEAAYGESAVLVCGGRDLVASVRNLVVNLSDERAVHKGTGAQGIALFAEEYSF